MAWTDQCKYAFTQTATFLYTKEDGKKKITRILKQLSNESGIPYKTLYRWWSEEKSLRNETNSQGAETTEETTKEKNQGDQTEPRLCARCHKNPVFIHSTNKKPYGPNSKWHGLCASCKNRQWAIERADKGTTQDQGIMVVCPNCNHVHYINKDRIKER